MKKLTIIISLLSIMLSSCSVSEEGSTTRETHKGKNYKPWEHKKDGNVNTTDREKEQGPKGKNANPWDHKEKSDSFSQSKERVTGPEYKNKKNKK